MKEYYKTIIVTVLLLAILVLVVNDGAAVAINYWQADKLAKSVADSVAASSGSSKSNENTVRADANRLCLESEGTLTGCNIDDGVVIISIETSPKKTLVAHRIQFLRPYLSGKSTARSTIH
ncbi:MAG TPA: hypothetical protein VE439_09870 [Anaerolineae bacterium]|nr:hypothetical protein [Anaerolineae bacterium]